jgi:hypothetical protein
MTKIALTAAAILVATGTAFAGSDHYGSSDPYQSTAPAANVDTTFTESIRKPVTEHQGANTNLTPETFAPEPGRGIWGR